ncbi:hypothetical protein OIDMADRAFT_42917 [Oidiodendron maius Zn]|uniref:Uncharacterized protein n=1 Tax=Oidiodendron maius (strain Zn) TaxID=913774 RepID=A0A0C3DDL8_OIDMZ|nr:hypothetical protein OIDMADRAFT_42917 [Oidiodendron maius Zn]
MVEVTKPTDPTGLILEAWAQGYMVGSIIIMICITVSNIKRKILLHKLILLELVLGILHGTFIFNNPPIYGWYLSVTATFLIISWSLHNAVAWIKTRPFLSRRTSIIFIVTVALVQPYWALEIYADFTYFNNINDIYLRTRVFEALFRDPWWVYTTCCLLYSIRTCYHFGFFEFMRISPRFAIMILAMILSIIFTVLDICAVTGTLKEALPIGINPFWKLAFVFRLLADSVILDDFKTALDKLSHYNLSRIEDQERSEPTVPPDVTIAGWRRPETNESAGSWVGVRTEIKVESFPMK